MHHTYIIYLYVSFRFVSVSDVMEPVDDGKDSQVSFQYQSSPPSFQYHPVACSEEQVLLNSNLLYNNFGVALYCSLDQLFYSFTLCCSQPLYLYFNFVFESELVPSSSQYMFAKWMLHICSYFMFASGLHHKILWCHIPFWNNLYRCTGNLQKGHWGGIWLLQNQDPRGRGKQLVLLLIGQTSVCVLCEWTCGRVPLFLFLW